MLDVDLTQPPAKRWSLSPQQIDWAQSLVRTMLDEIGGVEPYRDLIELQAANHLSDSLAIELKHIAEQCSCAYLEVLTANMYFDFVKLLLGCTAFAVNSADGPIHARNMDWFSGSNCLSEFTTVTSFNGDQAFYSIGWPGFAGAFSGIAPGRFTVTMNAALSNEPRVQGESIAFLIRDTLENCPDFESAIEKLSTTNITSDCLLLLTGIHANEMLVIERTPTQHAYRYPQNHSLILTNDFRVLAQPALTTDSPLYTSTCSRFAAAEQQLRTSLPSSASECFKVLSHRDVRMNITVQQMVMSAGTGQLHVRTGSSDSESDCATFSRN